MKGALLLQNVLATLSLVVIAITLVANAIQAREVARQSRIQLQTNRALLSLGRGEAGYTLSKLFFDHPQYYKYFYEDEPVPSKESERVRVQLMAEMLLDYMNVTIANEVYRTDDEKAAWRRFFATYFAASPAMMEAWARDKNNWDEPFIELIDSIVEERLRQLAQKPD